MVVMVVVDAVERMLVTIVRRLNECLPVSARLRRVCSI